MSFSSWFLSFSLSLCLSLSSFSLFNRLFGRDQCVIIQTNSTLFRVNCVIIHYSSYFLWSLLSHLVVHFYCCMCMSMSLTLILFFVTLFFSMSLHLLHETRRSNSFVSPFSLCIFVVFHARSHFLSFYH